MKKHLPRALLCGGVLILFETVSGATPAADGLVKTAPPLPLTTGKVIDVSTERELQAAMQNLKSNSTVRIAPGTYNLSRTLYIRDVNNVAIRGATGKHDDVVLVGRGMSNRDHGGVPHGIWIGGSHDVLIADLTVRDVYYHCIQLNPGAEAPHLYNLRLADAGEQIVKVSTDGKEGVDDGVVEYSIIEFTKTARGTYTNGVDVLGAKNWIIRHNLFRNIRAPQGKGLAGPAVLMFHGCRDGITEGNVFLNVQYGIAYGLDPKRHDDNQGGIIRNNFFYRGRDQSGDVGIVLNNSPGTKVLHNTVILSGTYPNAIEYRFPPTAGVEIRYNLCDAAVTKRNGARGTVSDNLTRAVPAWFVDLAVGDLHLSLGAAAAIDKAGAHGDVSTDYDGETRPVGAAADIGADEFVP